MTEAKPPRGGRDRHPQEGLDRDQLLRRELEYWERQFDPTGEHYDFVQCRLDPGRRVDEHPTWIDPYVAWLKSAFPDEPLRALDVGSGPLTNLAWSHETGYLQVTAIDPLGAHYADLLAAKGCEYPVLPVSAAAEDLSDVFEEGAFHTVYSRNALDHTEDVMAALRSISTILKPRGIFFFEGPAHEGARHDYWDLHKHDFFTRDGVLHCQDRAGADELRIEELEMTPFKVWPETTPPFSSDAPMGWVHAFFQKEPCSGRDPLFEVSGT
jgi:SAM-dependent methyltransferase